MLSHDSGLWVSGVCWHSVRWYDVRRAACVLAVFKLKMLLDAACGSSRVIKQQCRCSWTLHILCLKTPTLYIRMHPCTCANTLPGC